MQNVPSEFRGKFQTGLYSASMERRDEFNLRRIFRADPGCKIVSIDYKQMEMHMFAILAKENTMLNALRNGLDVHREVAKKVWGTGDDIRREWAKQIAFGFIYGMTMGSLRFRFNLELSEAQQIMNDYKTAFPRIQPWLREVVFECSQAKILRYWSKRIWREEAIEKMYKGANALIQGGCADLLSIAAIRVGRWLREQSSEHRILNYVHDEIVLQIPEEDVKRTIHHVQKIMEVEDLLNFPFRTDIKIGDNYGEWIKPESMEAT